MISCDKIKIAVVALLLVACLGCFWRLTTHAGDLLVGPRDGGNNDLTDYFVASRGFPVLAADRFGQAPFWNPYTLCGAPFVGNPQASIYYPPNWVYFWLDPMKASSWMLVLHHFVAGLGAYFLCRRYGCSEFAALTGGIVMLASPYLVAQTGVGHYNQICVVTWFPWAFLALERLRDGKRGGVLAVAVALSLCFFAGHAQELLYLVLTLTACLVWDVIARIRQKQPAAAAALATRWLLAGLATAGLVAIDLVPILIYTKQGVRAGGLTLEEAGKAWQLANVGRLVGYFGVLPLLLAAVAMLKMWDRPATRRMSVIGAIWFIFALGSAGVLYSVFYYAVPGIALFRVPARALFVCSIAVAVLAAVGVDGLAELAKLDSADRGKKKKWSILAVAMHLRRPSLASLAVAAACAVELSLLAGNALRTIPDDHIRQQNPLAAALARQAGAGRVLAEQALLNDRDALQNGLQKVQGYDPVPVVSSVIAISNIAPDEDPAETVLGFHPTDLAKLNKRVVDLLGIRYALVSPQQAELPPGWKRLQTGHLPQHVTLRGERIIGRPFELYENQTALPRAFVVGKTRLLSADDDHATVLQSIQPRSEIVLEHDVLPPGPRSEFRTAPIMNYTPNRVEVRAELDQPGYLFLSDTWYPGWVATVNGNPMPVLKANLAFRAVPLPAGQHSVVFRYSPTGLMVGVLPTAATSLILILVTFGVPITVTASNSRRTDRVPQYCQI